MNPEPVTWSRGLGPGAWAWGLVPGPASGNLERVYVLQPSSIKNDLDQYSIKKAGKTCTRSRLPLAARGRGPRPSRGASPLGYAARAMLPGLCCKGSGARDMRQGLCCTGYAAGAMLHGLCCAGCAAQAMLQGLCGTWARQRQSRAGNCLSAILNRTMI